MGSGPVDASRSQPESRAQVVPAQGISAVLPAYNEEALIERAVRRTAGVLGSLTRDFEVIVVNDGSMDQTGMILKRLARTEPSLRLRVVTHPVNQGYGAAVAAGFDAATRDLIFMTDGDEQFDVRELGRFVETLDPATDLVIGWRRRRADPPMRLFNAWAWGLLVNGLFGYTARDVDCAFKLIRRPVWQRVAVRARGATFSAELLVKARRLGFRVKERPVSHFPRAAGSATGARLDVIVRAFGELFKLRLRLDRELSQDHRSEPARSELRVGRPRGAGGSSPVSVHLRTIAPARDPERAAGALTSEASRA
ncbi:MAG: glycosyltransferase family 2 protein [Chloroflexota bacterium]